MKKKILVLIVLLPLLFVGCLSSSNTTKTTIPMPKPTNFPPVSNETRKDALARLVQENAGCELPCILGLTPGISDSEAVNAFMKYFQTNSHTSDNQTSNVNIDTFTHEDWNGTNLSFFEDGINVWIRPMAQITDGKVERVSLFGQGLQMIDGGAKKLFGDPYYDELLAKFSLSTILEQFGQPEQIVIRPFPDDEGRPAPPAEYTFDFVLFYPKQGFVAEYVSVRAEDEIDYIGCPTKSYLTHISAWNPEDSISITEAIQYFSNLDGVSTGNISEYKQLQDVTLLSLTEFYNLFRRLNSNACVKTSKEFWVGKTQ